MKEHPILMSGAMVRENLPALYACLSFPGYSVTDAGDVVSHRRRGVRAAGHGGCISVIDPQHCYVISQFKTKKGYLTANVIIEVGRSRPVGVHQLVADAFHGPVPEGQEVRHLNGIASDNRPENLKYGTSNENAEDRRRHGTYLGGSNHHSAKLTGGQAAAIRKRRRAGEKVKALAQDYGVSTATIESIIYNKSYLAPAITFKRVTP